MTLEEKYKNLMISLGTWNEAYAPVVHELCMLERDERRTRAAWKKTAPPGKSPSTLDPHYAQIRQQVRDAMALRDALGLTPKALRRMKGIDTAEGTGEKIEAPTILGFLRDKYA
ncbi:MAG: hypothetical protein IKE76_02860 [Clostridia bacterium]|nr:hypothetical protein [Clostridia bacterium]